MHTLVALTVSFHSLNAQKEAKRKKEIRYYDCMQQLLTHSYIVKAPARLSCFLLTGTDCEPIKWPTRPATAKKPHLLPIHPLLRLLHCHLLLHSYCPCGIETVKKRWHLRHSCGESVKMVVPLAHCPRKMMMMMVREEGRGKVIAQNNKVVYLVIYSGSSKVKMSTSCLVMRSPTRALHFSPIKIAHLRAWWCKEQGEWEGEACQVAMKHVNGHLRAFLL